MPALTESQVAQTAGAVTSGFKAGEEENSEAAQRAADARKETAREQAAAAIEAGKTEAAIRDKRVARVQKLNDDNYKTAAEGLTNKISAQQALLDDLHADKSAPEYKQVSDELSQNRAALGALSQRHTAFSSGNDSGQIEDFSGVAGAPQAPARIPLDAVGQMLQNAKEDETLYAGASKKAEYDSKYGPQAAQKPAKLSPELQRAVSDYSGGQSLLLRKSQLVESLRSALHAHPDDTVTAGYLKGAMEDLNKTQNAVRSSYSQITNGLASGAFGEDERSAYAQLAGALPAGADPTDIQNQFHFHAALQAKGGPNGEKLSPAEQAVNALLRGDQDVSVNWNGGYVPPAEQVSPMRVKAAIDNETLPPTQASAPTAPPIAAPPTSPAAPTMPLWYTTPPATANPPATQGSATQGGPQ